jgi:hypothetical protein
MADELDDLESPARHDGQRLSKRFAALRKRSREPRDLARQGATPRTSRFPGENVNH